mmetsp:Transcript_25222/g.25435  ORF Transcript_25222/g.25435 Transcript_25222/m.25435 type:complete len:239 (-) Transcript_25222:41-757(-)
MAYKTSFCYHVVVIASLLSSKIAICDESKSKKHPSCKGLWRPEKLVGRCFGLKMSTTYDEFKDVVVDTYEQCRKMCCNMEDKCVSWQYQAKTRECKLGGIIRLGTEGADTVEWCEPLPPAKWNGYNIATRKDGKCTWGTPLPTQCFGLGPERKSPSGEKYSTEECAEACCKWEENGLPCNMWQEIPGRGCFFNSVPGIFCEEYKGDYEGGRKCVQGTCGGMEEQILVPYMKKLKQFHH